MIKDYEITIWKSKAKHLIEALSKIGVGYELYLEFVHDNSDAVFTVRGVSKNSLKRKLARYNLVPKFFDVGHYTGARHEI